MMQANLSTAKQIVRQMVRVAEEKAAGPLPLLHRRAPIAQLEGQLRAALAPACTALLRALSGPGYYLQGTPNIRIHRPFDQTSVIPFHSDLLYGHSLDEINYWVNLTPVFDTNSLWLAPIEKTETLHQDLKQNRLSLAEFEAKARAQAAPIEAAGPGIHSFCCARVHGSVLNETDATRVSLDLRVLKNGGQANVKKRGGYFRPQWLPGGDCPLPPCTPVTTVASLDEPTPVYLQRVAMERFYPQGYHRELVEFHDLPFHHPTLSDAMTKGPVLVYSLRQIKQLPSLTHPLGFADERIWITPDQTGILEQLLSEIRP